MLILKRTRYSYDLEQSFNDIGQLIYVPFLIRDTALNSLSKIDTSILKYLDKQKLENVITSIQNINEGSIKNSFKVIYNQVCVLAVSALSATLEKYFKNHIVSNWSRLEATDEIKLSLKEIYEYNFTIKPRLGDIFLEKLKSINFQDLQSILRSFEQYCKKTVLLDEEHKSYIIFYQQARHVLVHKNGYVDADFLKRVQSNNKKDYKIGDKIELDEVDWINIQKSFIYLVDKIVTQISEFD